MTKPSHLNHEANSAPPAAVLRPRRRVSLILLVPLAALLFALWLGYEAWQLRGSDITVELPDGHGLTLGADVRYRGVTIGNVRNIKVTNDGIVVTASITSDADRIALSGSRFWIVRPQVGFTGLAGLDTLVGPRYLAVLPPDPSVTSSSPQFQFVGLAEPPVVETIDPGDLEVLVQGPQQGSLRRGGPVMYRHVRVGTILSVGLAGDSSAVEARLHIEKPFVPLIHANTRLLGHRRREDRRGSHRLSPCRSIRSPRSSAAGSSWPRRRLRAMARPCTPATVLR
jgi:paraquat-inducible protein B